MYGSAFAACPEIDMDQNFAAADVTTACKQALGIPCNANKADDLVDPDCTFMAVQSSTVEGHALAGRVGKPGGGEPQQVHYLLQTQLCSKCLAVL